MRRDEPKSQGAYEPRLALQAVVYRIPLMQASSSTLQYVSTKPANSPTPITFTAKANPDPEPEYLTCLSSPDIMIWFPLSRGDGILELPPMPSREGPRIESSSPDSHAAILMAANLRRRLLPTYFGPFRIE